MTEREPDAQAEEKAAWAEVGSRSWFLSRFTWNQEEEAGESMVFSEFSALTPMQSKKMHHMAASGGLCLSSL